VKVRMIQSVDSSPGHDTTIYFTDGTRAVVKRGSKLSNIVTDPDNVAPSMVKVTTRGKQVTAIKRVEVDNPDE